VRGRRHRRRRSLFDSAVATTAAAPPPPAMSWLKNIVKNVKGAEQADSLSRGTNQRARSDEQLKDCA